jgi:hypothetical protein
MNHKRKKRRNLRAGCKMCKPWKVNGVPTEREGGEKFSDHAKRAAATVAIALALSGCATTRYTTAYCVSPAQLTQLKAAKPAKIHSQLTGQADSDLKLVAGRLVRVEAWGDGLIDILGGCTAPKTP